MAVQSAKNRHFDEARTVEVLERTRQNFKSKELADLRRQLGQAELHTSFPRA